ncbi:MAG: hypothetical protein IJ935_10820 [Afipia sp.]|jgi:hypothetical protein|nr:hypothetical protein [Afipia sp.]
MLRRVSFFILLALAAVIAAAAPSPAQSLREINPTPFSHSPCSVLGEGPCTPYFCSTFNNGPCIPEIDYPYGENLQVTVLSKPDDKDAPKYVKPDHDLDTIGDLFAAIRSCWMPPPENEAQAGMQMSVKFSFKRDGGLIGQPRLTYVTPGSSEQTRKVYLGAINTSLENCAPLSLTKGLGGAIAGRPIMIRFVDNRTLKPDIPPPQP